MIIFIGFQIQALESKNPCRKRGFFVLDRSFELEKQRSFLCFDDKTKLFRVFSGENQLANFSSDPSLDGAFELKKFLFDKMGYLPSGLKREIDEISSPIRFDLDSFGLAFDLVDSFSQSKSRLL